MKTGEYIRTKYGIIAKITDIIEDLSIDCDRDVYYEDSLKDNSPMMEIPYNLKDEYIIKSSSNIIDLIERFDLVNGHLVICKMYEDEKDIPTIIKCVGDYYFKEEEIKSIVTKEQFSQMEYKVNE